MATVTKPQRYKTHSTSFHTTEEYVDGYISIASDGSVVAPATAAVPRMPGRIEPVAGTSWCSAGTIAKNGTGVYEVTLNHNYLRLIDPGQTLVCDGSGTTLALDVRGGADNVNPSTASGAQKLIFVVVNSSTGAPANPAAACGIRFRAVLKR